MCGAVQWGDVPTWISALATVVALVFAAIAAVVARRLYDVESQRDREAEQERRSRAAEQRRSQAARISAWVGNLILDEAGGPTQHFGVLVGNASELPAFDLLIRFHWRQGPGLFRPLGQVPASAEHPDAIRSYAVPVLPPDHKPLFVPIPAWVRDDLHESLSEQVAPELIFRDADGNRWRRDASGALTEAT